VPKYFLSSSEKSNFFNMEYENKQGDFLKEIMGSTNKKP
jgi:hypothetical protein